MLNENVKKLLAENMWDLATCGEDGPNVVPVAFKDVTADGKLVVGDVFTHYLCAGSKKCSSVQRIAKRNGQYYRCSTGFYIKRIN